MRQSPEVATSPAHDVRPSRRRPPSGRLDADEIAWLKDHHREKGERELVRETGLSRNTIARALAGLGLYPASLFVIRAARERASASR